MLMKQEKYLLDAWKWRYVHLLDDFLWKFIGSLPDYVDVCKARHLSQVFLQLANGDTLPLPFYMLQAGIISQCYFPQIIQILVVESGWTLQRSFVCFITMRYLVLASSRIPVDLHTQFYWKNEFNNDKSCYQLKSFQHCNIFWSEAWLLFFCYTHLWLDWNIQWVINESLF